MLAVLKDYSAVVERLLQSGKVKIERRYQIGVEERQNADYRQIPLQKAIHHGHTATARVLVDYGASLKVKDPCGHTVLYCTLSKALQSCGLESEAMFALFWGLLPEASEYLFLEDKAGYTRMHLGLRSEKSTDFLEGMIARAIDPMTMTKGRHTWLSSISARTNITTLRRILTLPYVDPNEKNRHGDRLLSRLAGNRETPVCVIEILLRHPKIDVCLRGPDGKAALTWAATTGSLESVKALLADGRYQLSARDRYGMRALDYAMKRQRFYFWRKRRSIMKIRSLGPPNCQKQR